MPMSEVGFTLLALALACGRDSPPNPLEVARARLVASGRFEKQVVSAGPEVPEGYLRLRFRIDQAMVGGKQGSVSIVLTSKVALELGAVLSRSLPPKGRFVVLPSRVDRGAFFVSGLREAITDVDGSCALLLRPLVRRVEEAAQWTNIKPQTFPSYAEVKALIGRLTEPGQMEGAIRKLESMGPVIVPTLVALMDDRTQVNDDLRVPTSGGFEEYATYRPKAVVDAVAFLLGRLTKESFGELRNGASEAERAATVRGWRAYVGLGMVSGPGAHN